VVDQACRIAAEAHAPYVGTEHLVVAILWQDTFVGAHELRRLGVSHARGAEQLAALPHRDGRVTTLHHLLALGCSTNSSAPSP
jgi:hypothetical protein